MMYNNITHVRNESLGSEFDEAQILPSADVQSILLCFCLVFFFSLPTMPEWILLCKQTLLLSWLDRPIWLELFCPSSALTHLAMCHRGD